MVWQVAKVAFGGRASGFAIGVVFDQCIPGCFGLGDSSFQIPESQLALVGVQLPGSLAVERVPQFNDQVILRFSPGLKARDLGVHGHKPLAHGGRKGVRNHWSQLAIGNPHSVQITGNDRGAFTGSNSPV